MSRQAGTSSDHQFDPEDFPNHFYRHDSGSEDEDNVPNVKKMRMLTRTQVREEAKLQSVRSIILEEELIQIQADPQNPDHFDQLLSYNPNSSFIWIKYMDCHVQAKDLEKARATAKRALSTIHAREKQEKLNIWTALLALEELHGTKETFKQTMDDALRSCDEYQIYIKVLEMFAKSSRLKELDELITEINGKFSNSIDAYLQCATVYFKLNKSDKARFIFQKALSNLPAKSHITMISEFALMENSDGSPEEAQTLFENILTCHPSRIDIWCLYVDMMTKSNRIDLARQTLERATLQQLVRKKRKSMLFKWMKFEGTYGTREDIKKYREKLIIFEI
ncbi:unnamed protein product [Macrosiphum euphorbiae]|uniref:Pre-mRNA-splicing factor Syf1/CRNKL1-like C-terminal HAT-repeats domain-containing protein n=1 Tax=Macrosiphum euphorbiae TaxID=13131 RepID=A0AAV0XDG2_9HEMI|nr:unnamed protein product [Macrosiphum euphorbiae]